jgi:hypothetical protein
MKIPQVLSAADRSSADSNQVGPWPTAGKQVKPHGKSRAPCHSHASLSKARVISFRVFAFAITKKGPLPCPLLLRLPSPAVLWPKGR